VAFLIEESNTTIRCLLNPESLVVRRYAGVAARRSAAGQLTGAGLGDDPLLYTGGGRTELELDLLFDTALVDEAVRREDVRDLTAPIWNLAENANTTAGYWRPPIVRFLWGKAWNVPGVVVAVAERLERFTPGGTPQRSWLRMRLVRVAEPRVATDDAISAPAAGETALEAGLAQPERFGTLGNGASLPGLDELIEDTVESVTDEEQPAPEEPEPAADDEEPLAEDEQP
jgi:hypothetical protein